MHVVEQKLDDILATLQPLVVEWQDDVAWRVIAEIEAISPKPSYTVADIQAILDKHFDDGMLILRLFLGLSKDPFTAAIHEALGGSGAGVTRYRADKLAFID